MTKSEYVKWMLEQQKNGLVYDGSGMRAWVPPVKDERQTYGRYVFTEPDSHGSPVRALAWAFLIVTVLAVGCVALVGL